MLIFHLGLEALMKFAMKILGWFWLAVWLLAACSPAVTSAPTVAALATPIVLSEARPTETLQPIALATSRGDKLEASAPASVKTGTGRPVLVEFFRFT